MKWNKYSIQTTTEAVDFISSMLGELGIEGIEIEDNVQLTQEEAKTMFVVLSRIYRRMTAVQKSISILTP